MQPESGEVPLIQELIETVERGLGERDVTVEGVQIGVFYTAVKLDSGQAGVAFTPIREIPEAVCCPRSASRMPAAGQLAGQRAGDLARYALAVSIGPQDSRFAESQTEYCIDCNTASSSRHHGQSPWGRAQMIIRDPSLIVPKLELVGQGLPCCGLRFSESS
jgi:hypothetical protein